jgi:hypothetical protein
MGRRDWRGRLWWLMCNSRTQAWTLPLAQASVNDRCRVFAELASSVPVLPQCTFSWISERKMSTHGVFFTSTYSSGLASLAAARSKLNSAVKSGSPVGHTASRGHTNCLKSAWRHPRSQASGFRIGARFGISGYAGTAISLIKIAAWPKSALFGSRAGMQSPLVATRRGEPAGSDFSVEGG